MREKQYSFAEKVWLKKTSKQGNGKTMAAVPTTQYPLASTTALTIQAD
jgi:hypothetical protein